MDGRRVQKKAGPSFFGWRERRDDYEIWVTTEGLKQTRGGTTFWEIFPDI